MAPILWHIDFVLWDLWECSKLVALCGVPLCINYCKFSGGVAFLWCGESGCLNFKEWEKWFKQNTVACDPLLCQTQCERLAHFEFWCRIIANLSLAWCCKTTSSSLHCSIWSTVSASQFFLQVSSSGLNLGKIFNCLNGSFATRLRCEQKNAGHQFINIYKLFSWILI